MVMMYNFECLTCCYIHYPLSTIHYPLSTRFERVNIMKVRCIVTHIPHRTPVSSQARTTLHILTDPPTAAAQHFTLYQCPYSEDRAAYWSLHHARLHISHPLSPLTLQFGAIRCAGPFVQQALHVVVDQTVAAEDLVHVDVVPPATRTAQCITATSFRLVYRIKIRHSAHRPLSRRELRKDRMNTLYVQYASW